MTKEKLLLVVFGTLVGLGSGSLFGWTVLHFFMSALPAGAAFDSVDDLRRSLEEHDARDVKADGLSLRSIVQPHPSDRVIFELRPNLNVTFQGVTLRSNSFGMRGPEIPPEKPAGTFRIALLGDSFAFGWGVEEDKTFARVLERVLNEQSKNSPHYEVLNFAVPGYSTFQEVSLFEEKALQFHPDAVLVYFVENDFALPFFIKNFHTPGEIVEGDKIKTFRNSDNDSVVNQSRELLGFLSSNRWILKLFGYTKTRGIPLMVAINPGRREAKDWRRLWALRRTPAIHAIRIRDDFVKIVRGHSLGSGELQLKGDPHPSALKHQILGELLAKHIGPILALNPS